MNDPAQLLPGSLDLLILRAVSLGPLQGYDLLLRIVQISGNASLIEQSALYSSLFRLIRKGLVKATWGASDNDRRAKFYELTAAGRKRLREETANWNRPARIELGGYQRYREECHAAAGGTLVESLLRARLSVAIERPARRSASAG